MLERFPPTRLGPNDMNLTSLYKPPSTAPDFVFNPRRLSQEEAEAYCQTQGGHLAAYISKTEQYLVEQTLVNKVGGAARLLDMTSNKQRLYRVLCSSRDCSAMLTRACCPPVHPAGLPGASLQPPVLDRPASRRLAQLQVD